MTQPHAGPFIRLAFRRAKRKCRVNERDHPCPFTFCLRRRRVARGEFIRLAAAVVPTVEALRSLTPQQIRGRVATMLERLGYELLTSETAADVVAMRDGKKYVVAFATPTDLAPTPLGQITRLHSVVVAASAAAGFFITPRGFTRDAEAYAATAPLKLVDGPKLIASIKRSMADAALPDSYKAMCRQCGEIVQHTLDRHRSYPVPQRASGRADDSPSGPCHSETGRRIDQQQNLHPAEAIQPPRSPRAQCEIPSENAEAKTEVRQPGTRHAARAWPRAMTPIFSESDTRRQLVRCFQSKSSTRIAF